MEELIPGFYEHYKGKTYEVIGLALHSETGEELVVYRATYQDPAHNLWVRPLWMFKEQVMVDGRAVPRFRKL